MDFKIFSSIRGYLTLFTCYKTKTKKYLTANILVPGTRILDIGYRILDTGYGILDTGYWVNDTGYMILGT